MEGLRTRAMVMGLALIGVGVVIQLTPAVQLVKRTEEFLEKKAPTQVGDFKFYSEPMSAKPHQSYAVGQETYDTLKPFGIVGRVYTNGELAFDVLLIASNDKNSFHDQRVCFSAQGWTLTQQTKESIETSRGRVDLTFARMRHASGAEQITAYFYRGPGGFHAAPSQLTWAMFWDGTDLEAVFYRFIPIKPDTPKESLLSFIKLYLEEAKDYSGGYF
jgi:hypothetical protein